MTYENHNDLTCPDCGHGDSTVEDSRPTKFLSTASRRRRRKCAECGSNFTTYEIAAGVDRDFMREAKRLAAVSFMRAMINEYSESELISMVTEARE